MKKTFLLIILIIVFSLDVHSQKSNIRGFVYDKDNGEPIIFCNVILKGTSIGSATDINGMYNISKVNPGKYTLIITYLGYDTLFSEITLNPGQILTKNFELNESSVKLNEVTISAEREEMKTEVKAASIKISKRDIEMIPTVGGESDIAQYLQVIPGVVFTGDQGGQLYIRGGSPIQNKVLMDGMIIYSPFHSIGLFSVFDTDIIRNTEVFTGGFNAEYGGRISSIMDIKTIDGNKKRISGKLSANTFGAKIFTQGPLNKNENASFVFSAKTSYLDKSSDFLYKYPILYFDEKGLPYSFTDIYGKISLNNKNGSKWNVFGFNFQDNVNYENISNLQWKSNGVGSEFILIPGSSPILIEGNVAYAKYNISLDEEKSPLRESGISGFNMGFDFSYFLPKGKIKYGFDIHGFSTEFLTYNSVNSKIEQNENTSEFSAYINYQINSLRWVLEPGFRIQKYTLGVSPEPRLGLKYIVNNKLRLKLATGLYSQNILSTSSDRDIVNLFSGIISSPEELPSDPNGETYKNKFQKARHLITGIEFDVSNYIDLQLEAYIKDFTQLTNINRNMTSNNDNQFVVETGVAQGIDLLVKFKNKKLYLWSVYSYGIVNRKDNNITYNPHFDRRHNINLVASYKFGRKNKWKSDLRWNIGSGFPFTQTQGFYENLTFSNGINTNYSAENGELEVEYADLNQGRLPYYHRLDFSISKDFTINKTIFINVTASVTNAYNRENIFYFNRIKYERVNQLPIMPSLGTSINF